MPPYPSPRRSSTNWKAPMWVHGAVPRSNQHEHRPRARATGRTIWASQIRASDEAVLTERLATTGLDPKKVGERVVDAIHTKTFYAFVGAVPADVVRARHRRIEAALSSPWVTHY